MADMYANGGANGGPRGRRSLSRRGRIATVVLACGVLAGGAFVVTEAATGGHPASAAKTAVASGPTGQAAVLSSVLSSAASAPAAKPSAASGAPSTGSHAAISRALARRRARRLLALVRRIGGEYGQFTFGTRTGHRTLAFERGSVVSAAGGDVTVRAKDGTTWTWVLASRSIIRQSGERVRSSALASGEPVFVGGVVTGATRDAKLVIIR